LAEKSLVSKYETFSPLFLTASNKMDRRTTIFCILKRLEKLLRNYLKAEDIFAKNRFYGRYCTLSVNKKHFVVNGTMIAVHYQAAGEQYVHTLFPGREKTVKN
jgi:hypothetical protein